MYTIVKENYKEITEIAKNFLLLSYKSILSTGNVPTYSFVSNISKPLKNLPFVILIGGVGGSGKSSFIDYCSQNHVGVYEESTIDCCKRVVRLMSTIEYEHEDPPIAGDSYMEREIKSKSDSYRTLLSKVKDAWCEFDDGPNKIVCKRVESIYRSDSDAFLVFINVREPAQIAHLKNLLVEKLNCIPVTLRVFRRNEASWSNVSDKTTNNYPYDIVVDNSESIKELEDKAAKFCRAVEYTNNCIASLLDTFKSA